ncbi:MAG: hypothetical protein IPL78_30895 [Chloroflexi bacterium]|nr:hypothetical protein [Chloroflexota bacterium]
MGWGNCFGSGPVRWQGVCKGWSRWYISIASVAGKVFNTVAGITLLLLGYGVLVIAAVTIGAAAINWFVLWWHVRRVARRDSASPSPHPPPAPGQLFLFICPAGPRHLPTS